jgi:transposase InsO family protein
MTVGLPGAGPSGYPLETNKIKAHHVWFVDETYVKVNGIWRYVYRAIDQDGQVIDVLVSAKRDAATNRRFVQRALTAAVFRRVRSSALRGEGFVWPHPQDRRIVCLSPRRS